MVRWVVGTGLAAIGGAGESGERSWAVGGGRVVGLRGARLLGDRAGFGWSCGPSGGCGVDAEHGEACEVGGCCEEVEVGVDLGGAAHSGSASAVAVAHHVAEFAFDFGSRGAVVVAPGRVLLALAVSGERGFVDTDADGPAAGGLGAFAAERAGGACSTEVGNACRRRDCGGW